MGAFLNDYGILLCYPRVGGISQLSPLYAEYARKKLNIYKDRIGEYTLFFIRIQFIRILGLRFGTKFFRKCGIICPYKRNVCQMKQQVKRSSLSIYLGVGVSGKSPKNGLEFRNISGSEKIKIFL